MRFDKINNNRYEIGTVAVHYGAYGRCFDGDVFRLVLERSVTLNELDMVRSIVIRIERDMPAGERPR